MAMVFWVLMGFWLGRPTLANGERLASLPTIDASLGVGMVGGVKALYAVLLALVLGALPQPI